MRISSALKTEGPQWWCSLTFPVTWPAWPPRPAHLSSSCACSFCAVVVSLLEQMNMTSGAVYMTSHVGYAFCSISIEKGNLSPLEQTAAQIYGLPSWSQGPCCSKRTTLSGYSAEHHTHPYAEDIMSRGTEAASSLDNTRIVQSSEEKIKGLTILLECLGISDLLSQLRIN